MSESPRHSRFNIPNLEKELNLMKNTLSKPGGRIVKEIPHVNEVSENELFYTELSNGTLNIYKKIKGAIRRMKVDADGYVYWE